MTTALWAWFVLLAFHANLPFAARRARDGRRSGSRMIIPAPPAAIGVFEAAGVARAQGLRHLDSTGALPFAIVLHISNFVPLVMAGAIALHFAADARTGARGRAQAATYT